MYKRVFDARNEDSVSYGTAEDKISANAKMIGGVVAGIGFGVGAFYAANEFGLIPNKFEDNVMEHVADSYNTHNDVTKGFSDVNQKIDSYNTAINTKVDALDTKMTVVDSKLNSMNETLNDINDGNGTVVVNPPSPMPTPTPVPVPTPSPNIVLDGNGTIGDQMASYMDKIDGGDWRASMSFKDGKLTQLTLWNTDGATDTSISSSKIESYFENKYGGDWTFIDEGDYIHILKKSR